MVNNWTDSTNSLNDTTINGNVDGNWNMTGLQPVPATATDVIFSGATFKDGVYFEGAIFAGCTWANITWENITGITFQNCTFESYYQTGIHNTNTFTDNDPSSSTSTNFSYSGTGPILFDGCVFNATFFENIDLEYFEFNNCIVQTSDPSQNMNGGYNQGLEFNDIIMNNCEINNLSLSGPVNPIFQGTRFSNTTLTNLNLGTQTFTFCSFDTQKSDLTTNSPNTTFIFDNCAYENFILTQLLLSNLLFDGFSFLNCTFPTNETYNTLPPISETLFEGITFSDGVTFSGISFKGVTFKNPIFDLSSSDVTFTNCEFTLAGSSKNRFIRGEDNDITYSSDAYNVLFNNCLLNNLSLSDDPDGYGRPTIKNFSFGSCRLYSATGDPTFASFSLEMDNGVYENILFTGISYDNLFGNLNETLKIDNATFTNLSIITINTNNILELKDCELISTTISNNTASLNLTHNTFRKGNFPTSVNGNSGELYFDNSNFTNEDSSESQHEIIDNIGQLYFRKVPGFSLSQGTFFYTSFSNNTGATSIDFTDATLDSCKLFTVGFSLNTINCNRTEFKSTSIGDEVDSELVASLNLTDATFDDFCTISNSDLSGSTLNRTKFNACTFSNTKLQNCTITNAHQVLNTSTGIDDAALTFPTFEENTFYGVLKTSIDTASIIYKGLSFKGIITPNINFSNFNTYVNDDTYFVIKTELNTALLGVNSANFDLNKTLDFSNCNFDGFDLQTSRFEIVDFTGANLDNTTFSELTIASYITLNGASINNCNLYPLFVDNGASKRVVNLTYDTNSPPDLRGLAEYEVSLIGNTKTVILIGANCDYSLDNPTFSNFDIYDSINTTAQGDIIFLEDCNFESCVFDNCNMGTKNGTYESTYNGNNSTIIGISWKNSLFDQATFTNCTFQETILNGCNLSSADMTSVEFDNCFLYLPDEYVWVNGSPNGTYTNISQALGDFQSFELPITANNSDLSVSVTNGVSAPDYRIGPASDVNLWELSFTGNDVGAGTDPIVIDVEGNIFELPHDERCYLYFKTNDNSCYINIKTTLRGKASFNKYFYIYFQGEEFILDIDTYRFYDPNSLSEYELRKAIDLFNINKLDEYSKEDIDAFEYIKITFANDDVLRITLGQNKHFLKFWRKNSSIKMINGNYNQEKNSGLILGKSHGKIMENLTSFVETNENVF